MTGIAVEIKDLTVRFNSRTVLADINLKIEAGRFVGILGPNGAGKSTLLKVILGLIQPEAGEVLVFGQSPRDRRRQGLLTGYLPQRPLTDPHFPVSVLEVVLMGRYGLLGPGRRPRQADYDLVRRLLRQVGMGGKEHRPIGELSGGEQQRVFIARALSVEPRLLLLDEPTISLDACAQDELYELLGQLKQDLGLTVIMVSHDIGAVAEHVEDIICLNQKVFVHQPPPIGRLGLEQAFGCSVEYLFHGEIPHRVVRVHND